MASRRVFLLNLDADLELGARGRYAPTRAVLEATERASARLLGTLVPEGDAVVSASSRPGVFAGCRGIAFCPTPRARTRLAELGATLGPVPSAEVLRRVARRDFAYLDELCDARVTTDAAEVLEHLRRHAARSSGFRLKRAYGMSGRGHRRVRGEPTAADVAFVHASMPEGLVVEPELALVDELAWHGYLRADGGFVSGTPCVQRCDPHGAWIATEPLGPDERAQLPIPALERSLADAALALHGAGYHGPFGIDAFRYLEDGVLRLRTRSEIHARYSMGWARGMGATRPDLEEAVAGS